MYWDENGGVEELLFFFWRLDSITVSGEIRDEMALVGVKIYISSVSGQNTKCSISGLTSGVRFRGYTGRGRLVKGGISNS